MLSLPLLLLATGFAIQPPGAFHGDEPVARDGERWLALRVTDREASLVATRLKVRPVFDEVLDAPGQASGRAVSSTLDDAHVVAFLRGAGLNVGTVELATVAPGDDNSPLPHYAIAFRARDYRIRTRCDPDAGEAVEGQLQFDCRIELSGAAGSQTLARMRGYRDRTDDAVRVGDDATPTLLFAGDLDRDGELDLIFDVSDHYNKLQPSLFLSSPAAAGELMLQAAQFTQVGC